MTTAMPLEHVDEVGSTSDELTTRAASGAPECALMARRQTGGRGRLGRTWQSLDGNLFLSVLLRPRTPPAPGHWSLLAAVALADALESVLPRPGMIRLKWPNDVLLQGAKVAGILLETGDAPPQRTPWLVIGFGVNLAAAPHGLGRATACVADAAAPPTPQVFAPRLLAHLSRWRARLAMEGFTPIRDAWLARGPAPGTPIAAGADVARIEGAFHGLAPDGALLVEGASGLVAVWSGEVA